MLTVCLTQFKRHRWPYNGHLNRLLNNLRSHAIESDNDFPLFLNSYFSFWYSSSYSYLFMICVSFKCLGFPGDSVGKNPAANAGDAGSILHTQEKSWVGKISWRRAWQPTPVFLPGESHGQRGLEGYSPGELQKVGHDSVTKTRTKIFNWLRSLYVSDFSFPFFFFSCFVSFKNIFQCLWFSS